MKVEGIQRRIRTGHRGDHTIIHYAVITAIPQAQGAIAHAYGNYWPLGVKTVMPLSVDAAVPRPREPLQNHGKSLIH